MYCDCNSIAIAKSLQYEILKLVYLEINFTKYLGFVDKMSSNLYELVLKKKQKQKEQWFVL